jgi:hypothetical protein
VKIAQLTVENFMRLHVVSIEVDPADNVVVISGSNASGKTSCLSAIAATLGGAAMLKGISEPIRQGEAEAHVSVDLGDVVVEAHFTRKGDDSYVRKVVVTAKDGSRYATPQAFLDERLGALSFDPLSFANAPVKEQLATLLSVVDLGGWDPVAYDMKRRAIYDQRTEVGRDVKRLEGALAGIPRPAQVRDEVDVTDLLDERSKCEAHNRRRGVVTNRCETVAAELDLARQRVAELEREQEQQLTVLEALGGEYDLAAIDEQIRTAGDTNKAVAVARAAAAKHDELDGYKSQYAALTDKLAKTDAYKAHKLAQARMPVEGLSFDETGVLYQGVPFSQASAAEQLRVSFGMAVALAKDVRVCLIRDASLLDADNLALIATMAEANDMQVFLERVADGEAVGFEIVDGSVRAGTPD